MLFCIKFIQKIQAALTFGIKNSCFNILSHILLTIAKKSTESMKISPIVDKIRSKMFAK